MSVNRSFLLMALSTLGIITVTVSCTENEMKDVPGKCGDFSYSTKEFQELGKLRFFELYEGDIHILSTISDCYRANPPSVDRGELVFEATEQLMDGGKAFLVTLSASNHAEFVVITNSDGSIRGSYVVKSTDE